jgi:ferrochelatase
MRKKKRKIAVVAFNLGGPDSLESVKPFLFNLFFDPYIIRQPKPIRWLIAQLISSRRNQTAQDIYKKIGGKSPILDQTEAQARALEKMFEGDDHLTLKVFTAMRYWHPFVDETIGRVKEFEPEQIVLLPLYPQYSTTTTESFFSVWENAAMDLSTPVKAVCCYPNNKGFVNTVSEKLRAALENIQCPDYRVLFSAHGLPEKFIKNGDPYQRHVEATVEAVVRAARLVQKDYVVCYQSRVGPVEWLRPYTDDEIKRAAKDRKGIILVPIAFVSEHSETLVELDIEYRELARDLGVVEYLRIETVQTDPKFIDGLAGLVREALASDGPVTFDGCESPCQNEWRHCAYKNGWPINLRQ